MPSRRTFFVLALLVPLTAGVALADTVRLKSGAFLRGKTKKTQDGVAIQGDDGKVKEISDREVEWVVKGKTYETYLEKLEKARAQDGAAGLAALADWAKGQKMLPEARELWEKVLTLEPENKKARAGLGHHLVDGKWLTEDEHMAAKGFVKFQGKWIKKENLAKAEALAEKERQAAIIYFDWEWTIEDDLTAAELEKKKAVVETWSRNLWKVGEGNFALREVTILDRTQRRGTMHTPQGKIDASMLSDSLWAKVEAGSMVLPGSCDPYTWLHELGHLLFNCPEEYDSPGGCPCVESTGAKGGQMQWCDAKTHSAEQAAQHAPCWEGFILKKYPKAKHPGPGGERPPVKIFVRDS